MSMLETNHIKLKYSYVGDLTLTNSLKEELLSGASYLTNNLHVLLLDDPVIETGLTTGDNTYLRLLNPFILSQKRYITPAPFHIKRMRPDRMAWNSMSYSPESIKHMSYGCGFMFGVITDSALATYDPAIHHDTMLSDFVACAFICGMNGDYSSANMYMAASDMMAKMIKHMDRSDTCATGTSALNRTITPYQL